MKRSILIVTTMLSVTHAWAANPLPEMYRGQWVKQAIECKDANPSEDVLRIDAQNVYLDGVACDIKQSGKDATGRPLRLSCSQEGGPKFGARGHITYMGVDTISVTFQRDDDRKPAPYEVYNSCKFEQ